MLMALVLAAVGCGRVADGTKEALNKGGELAGSAATEVIEGVTSGVEKSWGIEVQLSAALRAHGLAVGKVLVEPDSAGQENRLVVYLSTSAALQDTLQAIAVGQDGLESGRASAIVSLPANGADYIVFRFQSRTRLERKSRVTLN